jgi:hypothetical protein
MNLKEIPDLPEWEAWLRHPCTLLLREGLRARRETFKEQLAEGDFVDKTSSMLLVGVVAQCKLLRDIGELSYDLILQEIDTYDQQDT